MPDLIHDCPHCNAKKSGFDFGGELETERQDESREWNVLFVCRHCKKGVVLILEGRALSLEYLEMVENAAYFEDIDDMYKKHDSGKPSEYKGKNLLEEFTCKDVYPRIDRIHTPANTPCLIATVYEEAVGCFRSGHWTASVILFRRVIEEACLEILGNNSHKKSTSHRHHNLYQMIESLAESQKIVPIMKELASIIRLIGNDAAHESDSVEEETAKEIMEFAEMFLTLAFTLPSRVRAARKRRDASA